MAKNKRTIYLGLDYTQFTGGVTEVNRKMGLLDAEFKLAQQEAKNYGTETDKLGVRHDYLSQKIALQTQKVESAKDAYDKATKENKKSQKEVDALRKKLLNEQTALAKVNGEFKENTASMKKASGETRTFGDKIREVTSFLGVNTSPALEAIAKKFDNLKEGTGEVILVVGLLMTGLAKASIELANTADEILTLSSVTGIATDELQKMQYASDFLDVSVETMTDSMTKMTRNMYNAREGSKEASEAFKKLHLRITESNGQLRDANDVFYEAIDKLGQIRNETERDAIAMAVFGRSAKELNPLIEAGSKRMKELGLEAEDLGRILEHDTLEQAGAFKDGLDKLNKQTESLKLSLGTFLLPILTTLVETIANIPTPVLKTITAIAAMVAVIYTLSKALGLLTVAKAAWAAMSQLATSSVGGLAVVIGILLVGLVAVLAVVSALVGKKKDVDETLNSVETSMAKTTNSLGDATKRVNYVQRNAIGTSNFRGGRTWVGEAGPELVTLPPGSQIEPDSGTRTEINNYYITIPAKEVDDFNRVVALAKQQKTAIRRL